MKVVFLDLDGVLNSTESMTRIKNDKSCYFRDNPAYEHIQWLNYIIEKTNAFGVSLPDAVVWLIEEPNGHQSYVLTIGQEIVGESQQLEAIGVKIDILKAAKNLTK